MNGKDVFELAICTFRQREVETGQLEQHALSQELLFPIHGDFIMQMVPIIQENGESWPDLDYVVASLVLMGFEQDTADKDLVIRNLDSELATFNRT
jgi:hypothetical protein